MNERVKQLTDLYSHLMREDRMGTMLVHQHRMAPEDIEQVLRFQQEHALRFGEAAVALGLVSPAQVQDVLARQFGCSYSGGARAEAASSLVAVEDPLAPEAEEMRVLRSELKIRWFDRGRKSLSAVCVDCEQDANVLIANLGAVFSQLGTRTLVVDANLRRPLQHRLFGAGGNVGLSDMLAGRASLESLCAVPQFQNLFLLPAGTPAPNPQELLSRSTFIDLKAALEQTFDVTLYALPSYSSAKADVLTVAAITKGAVVVAAKDKTAIAGLGMLAEHLREVGVDIVGSVLAQPTKKAGWRRRKT